MAVPPAAWYITIGAVVVGCEVKAELDYRFGRKWWRRNRPVTLRTMTRKQLLSHIRRVEAGRSGLN